MLGSLCAFVLALAPQSGSSATAFIDDPGTHGYVGDACFSLDEAIRLANGELEPESLSWHETRRIWPDGVLDRGGVIDRILIDSGETPTILVEGELTPLRGQGRPVVIESTNAIKPILLGGTYRAILTLETGLARIRGLVLEGAEIGVEFVDSDRSPGSAARLEGLELRGQTEAGFSFAALHKPEGQKTSAVVRRVLLRDMPLGLRLQDTSINGGLNIFSELIEFDAVKTGIDLDCSGNGGVSEVQLVRSRSRGGESLVRVRRDPDSTQELFLRILHGDHVVTGDVTEIQGSDNGLTRFDFHHTSMHAGPGGTALSVRPNTAPFDLHGSENTLVGDVSLATSPSSPRIFLRNSLYRDGTVTLDTGGIPTLDWNRYSGVSLVAPAANRAPVILTTSEFHDSSIAGESASAPVILDNCYLEDTTRIGNVGENNGAPSPWIGLTAVADPDPKLGGTLRLDTALPVGIGAVWHIGLALRNPDATAFPYVIYSDLATLVPLAAILDQHKTVELRIPALQSLVGLEFHAQAVTFPLLRQPHVPPVHLPIGSLIRVGN